MSGPNCLCLHAPKVSPITAITANAWSATKTKFSFNPKAVIPIAPATIANKGRQHGAARAIKRAPTDPAPSSKPTMRVTRLVLISAKVSQSQQSRPRSEECQQWPTPTLDNPSDNSSPLFLSAPDQPATSIKVHKSAAIGPRGLRFHRVKFAVSLSLNCCNSLSFGSVSASAASAIETTQRQVFLPWPRKLMIPAVQIRRSRHTKVQVTAQDADSPNCKEDARQEGYSRGRRQHFLGAYEQ